MATCCGKIHAADEMANIIRSVQMVHVKDHIDFLFPGLKATWCEPIPKPVCFLDSPFAFKGLDSKAFVNEVTKDFVEEDVVIIPITKPVHFLDSPFKFEGIDSKAIVTELTKDFVEEDKIIVTGCREGSDIINVYIVRNANKDF